MHAVPARDPLDAIRRYHEQTKHRFNRFARSPGRLDWATQPDPFRVFAGAPRIDLVRHFEQVAGVSYDDLFVPCAPRIAPGLAAVSVFFRYSLGLSAWKQAGASRWALRVNPSSGNLHPTEGYAVLGPGIVGERPALCHYAPDAHALEQRCVFEAGAWAAATAALPRGAFLVGLTSIHWREAWKYGERAFRYCQHDIGHAVAAMRMAASLMGWRLRMVDGWSTRALATALGTDRPGDFEGAETEEPACLCVAWPSQEECPGADLSTVPAAIAAGQWTGVANQLSQGHVEWEAIDEVAAASRETVAARHAAQAHPGAPPMTWPGVEAVPSAQRLLLQRRSAVAMDGESTIDAGRFAWLLRRLMPSNTAPWDALWWEPRIHPVMFVHRVDGLEPGIYVLPRSPQVQDGLQQALRPDFAWVHPQGIPADLPLYLLAPLDARRIAQQLSCAQDIAADGYFSLGMIADFDAALAEHGPSFYRNLFWEAGAIGQMLYLEAEAVGARGTGIGCFFDEGVHELLGLAGHRFQSLYHFTIGMPVDDPRLQTHPGYPWE